MDAQVYVRVDNRLLHGQVVQFWIGHLEIAHLVVADDDMAENEAMQTIYRMALPETVELSVNTIRDLPAELERSAGHSTMVLLRGVQDLTCALECGAEFSRVTLGNVHAAPERARVTDSVYLSEEEVRALARLKANEIEIEIQTFPGEILRLVVDGEGGARWSRP
ncbi:MAG: PTS sugar transporter subunit IIB [Deltaproteobacteria bacterium]|nr:PTS sugar transporter subunit IIB [Deltaproteobacteria bacterium]